MGADCEMSPIQWKRFCVQVLGYSGAVPQTEDAITRCWVGVVYRILGWCTGLYARDHRLRVGDFIADLARFVVFFGGVNVLSFEVVHQFFSKEGEPFFGNSGWE